MRFIQRFAFLLLLSVAMRGQAETNEIARIDLPTALRLAGAQNLDLRIARERLAEAKANYQSTLWQFFPWVSPGISYKRHDDLIQTVEGNIIDVHKDSYSVGPSIIGQLDLGDAIYRRLAARQLVKATDFAVETQRQDAILAAAQGYFDLAKARLAVGVAGQAVAISSNYSAQLEQALTAGLAFKGDLLRVRVETDRNLITLRQAEEQQRLAAARLAELLHLNIASELLPSDTDLVPLSLIATNATADSLVAQALASRPELKTTRALAESARNSRQGAVYGPLIPALGAQIFVGGLGGGKDSDPGTFGRSEDYQLTLGWRLGPGGLFDRSRIHASESRLEIARLTETKLLDQITRQVVETLTRVHSLNDQIVTAQRAAQSAEESLRLDLQRKEFGIGAALETIQAEQELTRARLELLNAIAEQNRAQYALSRAIGGEAEKSKPSDSGVSRPKR